MKVFSFLSLTKDEQMLKVGNWFRTYFQHLVFCRTRLHLRPHNRSTGVEGEDITNEGIFLALVDNHASNLNHRIFLWLWEDSCKSDCNNSMGGMESWQQYIYMKRTLSTPYIQHYSNYTSNTEHFI